MRYTNKTEQVIMEALQKANVEIRYPISVNSSNKQPDCDICCDFMSTGVHIPKDSIDEQDFYQLQEKRIFFHKTWHWFG